MPLVVTKAGRRSGERSTAFFQAPARQRASAASVGRPGAGVAAARAAFGAGAFLRVVGRLVGFLAGDFAFDATFAFFLAIRCSSRVHPRGAIGLLALVSSGSRRAAGWSMKIPRPGASRPFPKARRHASIAAAAQACYPRADPTRRNA
jgi:hypothetical protein